MSYESDIALLAAGAYWDVRKFANDPPFDNRAPLPAGWEVVPEHDRQQSGGIGNGFSARVYKNTTSGDVVISYGGTEFGNTLSGFIADFINGNIPLVVGRYGEQALEAAKLYQQVKADASLSDNISFTGHSLGGGLASVMAVWFNRPAMVFAAAPFQASADGTQVALLGVSVPALYQVKSLLTQAGIPLDPALESYNPLVDFSARETNVTAYAIKGEELEDKLGGFNWIESTPNPLFNSSAITLDAGNKHSIDLHAAALLVPNFQVQAAVVPTALAVLMDATLYGGSATGNQQLLITKLVRNEVGVRDSSGNLILSPNEMLSHFTADLQKLGNNLAGLNTQAQSAIVAQGVEWYYWQTNDYSGQEFLSVSNGVLNYTTAKGADLEGALNKANPYVNAWLGPLFSIGAVQTTGMRAATDWGVFDEWHVSTAVATTTAQAVDANKVQIFVGNTGADTFIGGNKDDVMLGGEGNDILAGGGGNDKVYGGAGVDYYTVTGDFGKDVIADTDGQGVIQIDGHAIGAATSAGRDVWVAETASGQYVGLAVYESPGSGNGKTLVITRAGSTANTITINNFNLEQAKADGYMGIRLDNTQKVALVDKPGTSVFSQPGFNTDTLNGLMASLKEGVGKAYILMLATAAKAGDTITLALGGVSSGFKAILGDTTVTANGAVITLKEGQTQVGFALVPEEGISEDIEATLQAHYSGAAGNASSNSWDVNVSDAGEVEGSLEGDIVAVSEELEGDSITRLIGTEQVEVVKEGELYFEVDAQGNLKVGTLVPTQRPIYDEHGEVIGMETIPSNDQIVTDNVLFGGGGRDRINGLTGNDALVGGAEADELDGGTGNDLIAGGAGSDVIKGGAGNDIISSAGDLPRSLQQLGPGDLWSNWGLVAGVPLFTQGGTWGAHGTVTSPKLGVLVDSFFRQGDTDGDVIDAGAGDDCVIGSDGADAAKGGEGNDAIAGLGGNDVLEGGDGNDVMEGDSTTVPTAQDVTWTPAFRHGDDFLDGGTGNDTLWGNGGNDQLFGGTGNDALIGDDGEPSNPWTLGADHHGQDYLDGEDGNDILIGGGGADVLHGGTGDDELLGDDRSLTGGRHGNDYLDGQDGDDWMAGGGGADRLYGGVGNDTLRGDDDSGYLAEEFHGDDYLDGGTGNDVLIAGGGNDVLVGGAGQDLLLGGDGDDYYVVEVGDALEDTGGTNTISMLGGEPVRISVEGKNLVMHFESAGDLPQLALMDGIPMTAGAGQALGTVVIRNAFEGGAFELNGVQLNNDWFGTFDVELTTTEDNQHLSSWAGNDTLTALHDGATLDGGAGNNVLKGGAGDDILISRGSSDHLHGGAGNDTFKIAAQAGTVQVVMGRANMGFGNDTLVLPGSAADTRLSATVVGADAVITTVLRTVLEGGEVVESAGPTVRLVNVFADGVDNQAATSISMISFEDGSTVSLQQVLTRGITGTQADDVLQGTVYADGMDGGGGDDQLFGQAGDDQLMGGDGNDRLEGGSGRDTLDGGAGNDVLVGGYGSDVMRGGAGDDVYLFGSDATPTLENDLEEGLQVDVIHDTEGHNTIEFGDGVNLAGIVYGKVSDTQSWYFFNGRKIEVHGFADQAMVRANGGSVAPVSLALPDVEEMVEDQVDNSLTLAQQEFLMQREITARDAITGAILQGAFSSDYVNASSSLWKHVTSDDAVLQDVAVARYESVTTTFTQGGYVHSDGIIRPLNWISGEHLFPLPGENAVEQLQAIFNAEGRQLTVLSAVPSRIYMGPSEGNGPGYYPLGTVIGWSWQARDETLEYTSQEFTYTHDVLRQDAYAASVILGDADNAITVGAGVVHAGAGNDSIGSAGNWFYPATPAERDILLSGLTANYLDGGDGDDVIRGSELNDVIVGGRGRDQLDGRQGSDRYLVLDYGVDSGDEDIISDLLVTVTGPYQPLSAPLDLDADLALPQTENAGHDFDVVEFGPGIALADVDLLREPDAQDPAGREWLVVSVQGRRLASIELAGGDDPAGAGVEALVFQGGDTLSMMEALALARTTPPLRVGPLAGVQTTEDGEFQYGVGDQISGGFGNLSFSAMLVGGVTLPAWLKFDAATRTFSGTPTNAPAGTLTVKLIITDALGDSVTAIFPIEIEGVNDAPIAAMPVPQQVAVLGEAFHLQLPAGMFSDVDAGDSLSWHLLLEGGAALPAWLSFNPTTRTLSGTPGNDDLGGLVLNVVVTDQAGATASQTIGLGVYETDPAYVQGTSEADTLYGTPADNIMVGAAGDDTLLGGEGNDVYLFAPGDGRDSVIDVGTPGNIDTIRFAAGVLPSQIRVAHDVNGLLLQNTSTGDSVLLHDWSTDPGMKIERVEFADGTVWDEAALLSHIDYSGTPGDDYILGTPGADTLDGLGGDDYLEGGAGSDVYLYGRGTGEDWIYDYDETLGNIDTLRFDATVAPADVTIKRSWFHDISFSISGAENGIGVGNWLLDDASKIERVEFADGTVWNVADIQQRIVNAAATNGPDVLIGYLDQDDALDGGAGDDSIYTGSGNDTLTGGLGNDYLEGDVGQDVYLFSLGHGIDIVVEVAQEPGADVVRFDATVAPADITLSRDDYNLYLDNAASGDRINLAHWFANDLHGVEEVQFADGTTWGVADILSMLADGGGSTNAAPVAGQTLAGQTGREGEAWSYTLPSGAFSDPDANDTLTWSASLADGGVLPSWLSFNAQTRVFSGTPPVASAGNLQLRVTVTDLAGATASSDFALGITAGTGVDATGSGLVQGTPYADTLRANAHGAQLVGGAGDDTLVALVSGGSIWDITFDGSAGNDTITGSYARDLYKFNLGDGHDVISDDVRSYPNSSGHSWFLANPNDESFQDQLQLGVGIAQADVALSQVGNDLRIAFGGTADSITVRNWFDGTIFSQIERISFASGAVWTLQDVASILAAGGTVSGNHAPTVAAPLPAQAAVHDVAWSLTVPAGTFADVDLESGDSLTYTATQANGSALPAWLTFDAATRTFSGTPVAADLGAVSVRITATDSTGLSVYTDFAVTVVEPAGITATGSGLVQGTVYADTLRADAHGAQLVGGAGNDELVALVSGGNIWDITFEGGAGNDTITGSYARDLFKFNLGDGQDVIYDDVRSYPSSAGHSWFLANPTDASFQDRLLLGAGITQTDVTLSQQGIDLKIAIGSGTDQIVVKNWFDGTIFSQIEQIAFASGALWSTNDVATILASGGTVSANHAPTVVTPLTDQAARQGEAWSFTFAPGTFGDLNADSGDTLTYTATLESGASLPSWLSFDAATRTFSGTPDAAAVGGLGLKVQATDSTGASVSSSFTVTIAEPVGITLTGGGVLQGTAYADTLTANAADAELIGGAGNDMLVAAQSSHIWDIVFEGGAGNDTLSGTYARDQYRFGRGDGQDTITDDLQWYPNPSVAISWVASHPDDPDFHDRILFGSDIAQNQIWFQQAGNDLRLHIIGTQDSITIAGWFQSEYRQIERFELADGSILRNTEVDDLVNAMAAYTPPPQGQVTLTGTYSGLSGVIDASWS